MASSANQDWSLAKAGFTGFSTMHSRVEELVTGEKKKPRSKAMRGEANSNAEGWAAKLVWAISTAAALPITCSRSPEKGKGSLHGFAAPGLKGL